MLFRVFGCRSLLGWPAIVTRPFFVGCLYCRWLPSCPTEIPAIGLYEINHVPDLHMPLSQIMNSPIWGKGGRDRPELRDFLFLPAIPYPFVRPFQRRIPTRLARWMRVKRSLR